MTDKLFEKILDHVRQHQVPPMPPLLPNGIGVEIVSTADVARGRPELGTARSKARIRINPQDYEALKERVARYDN